MSFIEDSYDNIWESKCFDEVLKTLDKINNDPNEEGNLCLGLIF